MPPASASAPPPAPVVRPIGLMRPLVWLELAWHDIVQLRALSFAHGLAVAAFGALMVWAVGDRFWLLAGAFSGFLVVAPVLATSLYALSRALERGEPTDWHVIPRTWLAWQHEHAGRHDADYWVLVRFGLLLGLAGTGWVVVSAALIALYAPAPVHSLVDFVRAVVLAREGWLFEAWLMLGGVLAAPIFASSVVAMPMLLDRRVTLMQAVTTSWQAVIVNPVPMAIWAALVLGFTLLGLGAALIGLVPVMPMLGHASWHAYRDLVDVSGLPPRELPAPGAEGAPR